MVKFWIDDIASKVVERESRLKRNLEVLRVEAGIGASGIPHIGSVGDAIRAYGVKLGIEDLGCKSELIAYSDDRDGLRKVPAGMPSWLKDHLGKPVTDIPDPFKCHSSYGEHMSSLLIDALDRLGVEYKFISGTEAYRSGLLDEQIHKILVNYERVMRIVREMVGSSKPEDWIPYWPVCENCGRIYTTHAYKLLPDERKVLYKCEWSFKNVEGCGYEGEASYVHGNGKLPWKGEFAARWAALGVVFEARGKDIDESFKVNMKICREILEFEPPLSILYEVFLDKSGRKISKSRGEVFTPQDWLEYAPPETLRYLMYKRFQGTRTLSIEDIPYYIIELEDMLRKYWNLESIKNERERINTKRIVEYTFNLKKVPKPSPVSFSTVLNVVRMMPWSLADEETLKREVARILSKYYSVPLNEILGDDYTSRMIEYAKKYFQSVEGGVVEKVKLEPPVENAIKTFVEKLRPDMGGEKIQDLIFHVAREKGVKPAEMFKALYILIIGRNRGPRLGPLIAGIGVNRVKSLISRKI